MAENKNITYLNKTFGDFKGSLQDFAKTYFPSTYNDFGEASTGQMFMEIASYVGDVLSFYLDTQFQENLFLYTKEKANILAMAYAYGYRPRMSYSSIATVDIYQLLPIATNAGVESPDWTYGLVIDENTEILSSSTTQKFITTQKIDFTDELAEISIYNATYFLAKKSVQVVAGEIRTTTYTFTSPIKFNSVVLNDDKILQVLSVVGDSSNNWYEVPYLAQETILQRVTNPTAVADSIPYLTSFKKVPQRFVTRFQSDGSLKIQFGAGTSTKDDTVLLPDPDQVNLGNISTISNLEDNYNKAAVLFSKEYGIAPANDILTVTYLVGGGIETNVPAGDISRLNLIITTSNFKNSISNLDPYYSTIVSNVTVVNPEPATGGRDGDTVEEIRLNGLAAFSAQNRAVTREDYSTRALSMPSDFGSVAKATVVSDLVDVDGLNNPLALSLYILGYNSNKNLVLASNTLKNNLKTYIQEYRMATDAINIKNAFIINIGINFDITISPGYNNKEILSKCIQALQSYFNIDRWQINQPIQLADVHGELLKVKGVQSVAKIEIINKQGGTYSQYGYDIEAATKNHIIYPSLDLAIFEIKFPNNDITGRVIRY